MQIAEYDLVRPQMQPGDVIAFGGETPFSMLIKWATRSAVSHVGVVFESKVFSDGKSQQGIIVDVMESTNIYSNPETNERKYGVQRNRLSTRLKYYPGNVWWLPLSAEKRSIFNYQKFTKYMLHVDEKPYDVPQAVLAGLDYMDKFRFAHNQEFGLTYAAEDLSSFFCSELVASAFKEAGIIDTINASEVTPVDLCSFTLYAPAYYLLTGHPDKKITGYNSRNPEGFGTEGMN